MARILCFTGDLYEDLELWYPKFRLEEQGHEVVVVGLDLQACTGKHGYPCVPDGLVADQREEDYEGLLIPGGFMPDRLRREVKVLELTRQFDAAGKLIGQICHAGWIPISAGILKGRRVTSTPGIRDDMENAGAVWIDEPVVVDRNLISARRPPDLPAFGRALVEWLG